MLFALLQCMSPLAHAHVNGVDAGHILFSHDLNSSASSPESHAQSEQGAVIALSPAYPASERCVVSPAHLAALTLSIDKNARYIVCANSMDVVAAQLPPRHILPGSQAPPI